MRIAILTFDGFNELDSFIAFGLLNRLKPQGWKAEIAVRSFSPVIKRVLIEDTAEALKRRVESAQ